MQSVAMYATSGSSAIPELAQIRSALARAEADKTAAEEARKETERRLASLYSTLNEQAEMVRVAEQKATLTMQEAAQLRECAGEARREMEHSVLASAQEAHLSAAVQVTAVQEESSAQFRSHQSERQTLEASLDEARKRIRYMQSEQQRELVAKVGLLRPFSRAWDPLRNQQISVHTRVAR